MTVPELRAFHVGMVVRSLDETMKQYSAIFGIENWHHMQHRFNGLRFAYGRGAGQTFELFEVTGPGDSHLHQFYKKYGEGVNHIGFWAEDVPAAARHAVEAGASLLSLTADAEGNATALLIPTAEVTEANLNAPGLASFVSPTGGVLIEFVGRAAENYLRDWVKEAFDDLVIPPPWVG